MWSDDDEELLPDWKRALKSKGGSGAPQLAPRRLPAQAQQNQACQEAADTSLTPREQAHRKDHEAPPVTVVPGQWVYDEAWNSNTEAKVESYPNEDLPDWKRRQPAGKGGFVPAPKKVPKFLSPVPKKAAQSNQEAKAEPARKRPLEASAPGPVLKLVKRTGESSGIKEEPEEHVEEPPRGTVQPGRRARLPLPKAEPSRRTQGLEPPPQAPTSTSSPGLLHSQPTEPMSRPRQPLPLPVPKHPTSTSSRAQPVAHSWSSSQELPSRRRTAAEEAASAVPKARKSAPSDRPPSWLSPQGSPQAQPSGPGELVPRVPGLQVPRVPGLQPPGAPLLPPNTGQPKKAAALLAAAFSEAAGQREEQRTEVAAQSKAGSLGEVRKQAEAPRGPPEAMPAHLVDLLEAKKCELAVEAMANRQALSAAAPRASAPASSQAPGLRTAATKEAVGKVTVQGPPAGVIKSGPVLSTTAKQEKPAEGAVAGTASSNSASAARVRATPARGAEPAVPVKVREDWRYMSGFDLQVHLEAMRRRGHF